MSCNGTGILDGAICPHCQGAPWTHADCAAPASAPPDGLHILPPPDLVAQLAPFLDEGEAPAQGLGRILDEHHDLHATARHQRRELARLDQVVGLYAQHAEGMRTETQRLQQELGGKARELSELGMERDRLRAELANAQAVLASFPAGAPLPAPPPEGES